MRKTLATNTVQSLLAVTAAALACAPATLAAATVSPLPQSDYGARPVCTAPAPRHVACQSLQLVPETAEAAARTHPLGVARAAVQPAPSPASGSFGLRPQDVHSAYSLPTTAPGAQTIAIVDAFNDPTAASDLRAYEEEFGLPACTPQNGCFSQVNENGGSSLPFPASTAELEAARSGTSSERRRAAEAAGWGLEISLDIEAAQATCQSCHLLLVEGSSSAYLDLEAAERTALSLGAGEVSNSWGAPELEAGEIESSSPFHHPGAVITASAGDNGYLDWSSEGPRGYAEFPASSPHVVAVGGTRLTLNGSGGWAGETVWNGNGAGGGGCSIEFEAPSWQRQLPDWAQVGCGARRAVADVSADADPYTGLAVHYSSSLCESHGLHWCTIGGTSLASPIVAAVFALAGGAGGVAYPASTLYENASRAPAGLHDVTSGSNGQCSLAYQPETGLSSCTAGEESASCSGHAICLAGAGYDGPTGVGTPNGIGAFLPTGAQQGEEEGGAQPVRGGGPGAGAAGAAPAPPPAAGPVQVNLAGLTLTLRALVALNRGRPRSSQVSFAFDSSALTQVRATLARHVRRHRRLTWQLQPGAVTLTALPGRNTRRLGGNAPLARGLYKLTLTPANAPARSIEFQIG